MKKQVTILIANLLSILNQIWNIILTKRELEVLELLSNGFSCHEIGSMLNLSVTTIITHKNKLKCKLKAKNLCHLTKQAICAGYLLNLHITP